MADPKEQRVVAQLVIGGETYDVVPKVQKDTSEVPLQAALNSNERMVATFTRDLLTSLPIISLTEDTRAASGAVTTTDALGQPPDELLYFSLLPSALLRLIDSYVIANAWREKGTMRSIPDTNGLDASCALVRIVSATGEDLLLLPRQSQQKGLTTSVIALRTGAEIREIGGHFMLWLKEHNKIVTSLGSGFEAIADVATGELQHKWKSNTRLAITRSGHMITADKGILSLPSLDKAFDLPKEMPIPTQQRQPWQGGQRALSIYGPAGQERLFAYWAGDDHATVYDLRSGAKLFTLAGQDTCYNPTAENAWQVLHHLNIAVSPLATPRHVYSLSDGSLLCDIPYSPNPTLWSSTSGLYFRHGYSYKYFDVTSRSAVELPHGACFLENSSVLLTMSAGNDNSFFNPDRLTLRDVTNGVEHVLPQELRAPCAAIAHSGMMFLSISDSNNIHVYALRMPSPGQAAPPPRHLLTYQMKHYSDIQGKFVRPADERFGPVLLLAGKLWHIPTAMS